MTCFISIEGTVAYHSANDSGVNRILVWGNVHDCAGLTVRITTDSSEFEATGSFPTPGGWVAVVDVSGSGLICGAVADVDLLVTCTQNANCSAQTKVDMTRCQVEGGCPAWEKFSAAVVDASEAGCVDGARQVRLEAQLPLGLPAGFGPVFAEFYIRPIEGGVEDTLGGQIPEAGETLTAQTMVPGGLYIYGLRVLAPEPCEGPTGVIEVPACPPGDADDPALCPQALMGNVTVSAQCTATLQRMVSATAVVTPEPGNPVSAQLVVKDGDAVVLVLDSVANITDETVLNGSGPVSPGNYAIGVDVTSPQACNFSGQSLRVAQCSDAGDPDKPDPIAPAPCPQITMGNVVVSDLCTPAGQRTITAVALVAPQADAPTDAELVIMQGGTVVATLDATTGASIDTQLSGSADIAPGDYTVVVNVSAPANCEGQSTPLTVAGCGGTTDGDDDFQIPWCLIALIAALVVLLVGAVIFGVAFCVIGFLTNPIAITIGVIAIVIGLILLVLGNILFIVWLFTCGSCRLNCGHLNWLQLMFTSLAAGSAFLAFLGWVAGLVGLSALCFVGWGIDSINFALLALLVTYWRKIAGCDPWPPGWPRQLRITLPPALTNLCRR